MRSRGGCGQEPRYFIFWRDMRAKLLPLAVYIINKRFKRLGWTGNENFTIFVARGLIRLTIQPFA